MSAIANSSLWVMTENGAAEKPPAPRQWPILAFLSLVTLGMAAGLFIKIHRHAVNILFSDQWDTYRPLFYDYDAWRSFTMQVGPVRLGAGVFVSEAVAIATGWNTRAEAFVVGGILLVTVVAALYLKWRLFNRMTLWDSLIPLIFLGPPQIAAVTVVTFPAYSAVPILLLMFYALCLTCRNIKLRYGLSSLLNFLLVFSCWGIFVGFLAPLLLGYSVYRHAAARQAEAKRWAAFALSISLLSLGLFFIDYKFRPAVECFSFPHYPLRHYLWFVGHMFSYSVGVPCGFSHSVIRGFLTGSFGILLGLTFVAACMYRLWKLAREKEYKPGDMVIPFFFAFSFSFALSTAIGRVCLGICTANSWRYQALLLPAWLGLYFTLRTFKKRPNRTVAGVLMLMFCVLLPQWRNYYYETGVRHYAEVKRNWKKCYLEKRDAASCDKEVGTSIFAPVPSVMAQDRLDYLEQRGLNFFSDR